MSQNVVCNPANRPAWPQVAQGLAALGHAPILRMIDGQLAFSDETPGEDWNELRVSLAGGAVTLRRRPSGYEITIWGNADATLRAASDTLAWVVADLSSGTVETENGPLSAAAFRAARLTPHGAT